MKYNYKPNGVCSREMSFEIENNIIKDFEVIGGCSGNLHGIRSLIIGENIEEVIKKLDGIICFPRRTSCPDQISKALISYRTEKETIK
jgi:uncharacterized protein TIGR03905